jgi:hypothetical protein
MAAPHRRQPSGSLGVRRFERQCAHVAPRHLPPGKEAPPDQPFFVDLARRAAETGRAITRAVRPSAIVTRFGAFEVAGLDLARGGTPATECLGFRFANAVPDLRITGFACGGPALV